MNGNLFDKMSGGVENWVKQRLHNAEACAITKEEMDNSPYAWIHIQTEAKRQGYTHGDVGTVAGVTCCVFLRGASAKSLHEIACEVSSQAVDKITTRCAKLEPDMVKAIANKLKDEYRRHLHDVPEVKQWFISQGSFTANMTTVYDMSPFEAKGWRVQVKYVLYMQATDRYERQVEGYYFTAN